MSDIGWSWKEREEGTRSMLSSMALRAEVKVDSGTRE